MKRKVLTLTEETKLFVGADPWHTYGIPDKGIPSLTMSDGPHGLRIETKSGLGFNTSKPAVCYPTASALGCTFDPELMQEFGRILAEECAAEGVDILLGPGVNHKRSPLCGRNFEYFSEDPLLTAELASGYIQGLQDNGIAACLKHFAGNSREMGRLVQDSVIDERTLYEIYLRQFEKIIRKSRPAAVMAAYNLLNGTYCCENKELLTDILRHKWGYQGVIMSDWGAVSDPVMSAVNGLDVEMPGGDHGTSLLLKNAYKNKILTDERISTHTDTMRRLAEFCSTEKKRTFRTEDHLAFAQKLAERSAVLLKNDGSLPLSKQDDLAVVGLLAKTPRYQGTGSSKVNSITHDSLCEALDEAGVKYTYAQGYHTVVDEYDPVLGEEAVRAARTHAQTVVVVGLTDGFEAEGYDRTHLDLPKAQNQLINRLLEVNTHLIIVLQCGAPVVLPWAEDVSSILCQYLSGCQGGHALYRLLYGEAVPCGKLAETFPMSLESTPGYRYYADDLLQVQYREGIFTGYRYYDTFGIPVRYPFGHGLSYTTFDYSDLKVRQDEGGIHVSLKIQNTGKYDGAEIVQLYMQMKDSRIARAKRELIGFKRQMIKAGDSAEIDVYIPFEDLSYYDIGTHERQVEEGMYTIMAGSSSEDIRLSADIAVNGCKEPVSTLSKEYIRVTAGEMEISQTDFISMLGHDLPQERAGWPFHRNTTVRELGISKAGRAVHRQIGRILNREGMEDVRSSMVFEAPLRMMLMAGKGITWQTVDEIAKLFNGHVLGSIRRIRRSLDRKH